MERMTTLELAQATSFLKCLGGVMEDARRANNLMSPGEDGQRLIDVADRLMTLLPKTELEVLKDA